ncbi:TPA: hypothetical protein ACHBXQ_005208 [Klebsiella variicola subsp. variicola]
MLRWLYFWALFSVLLFVAWRLAGMLVDLVLLVVRWSVRIKRGLNT